jgi:hypothetical protein
MMSGREVSLKQSHQRLAGTGPEVTQPHGLAAELEQARAELDHLRTRVRRLERALVHYERIAAAVQRARFWDYSVYESVPDDEWVAIDREDCDRLLHALGFADRWRPWKTILERRHAD